MARWERHQEKGFHNTFPYAFLNKEACIWFRKVRACLILGFHFTRISSDRVCLVYALMADVSIYVGAAIRAAMRKARMHKKVQFSFGETIQFWGPSDQVLMSRRGWGGPGKSPWNLRGVDVTKVKCLILAKGQLSGLPRGMHEMIASSAIYMAWRS